MRIAMLTSALGLLIGLCGCGARGNVDLLEARLREQEDRLLAVEGELQRARNELAAARRESNSFREQLTQRGHQVLLPEQAHATFRAERIVIQRLLSGGIDRDGLPGDDVLVTVITPVDAQGDLVKVPGEIALVLLDLSKPVDAQRIGHWTFDADQSAEHWHSGILASGYQFKLPWQQPPTTGRLLLHARLTSIDGRQFDAALEIRVTPAKIVTEHRPDPAVLPVGAPGSAQPSAAQRRPRFEFPWAAGRRNEPAAMSPVHPAGDWAEEPAASTVYGEAVYGDEEAQGPFSPAVRTSDRWRSNEIPLYR